MSTSLKRHPSGEAEESPEAKRTNNDTTADISPLNLATTLLSPPTKVEGCSMTDKISQADKTNSATSTSILNTGFKLSTSTDLFSNGKSESSSNNIFAQALASNSSSIFGQTTSSSSTEGGFVFGSNLSDRAVVSSLDKTEATPAKEKVTFTETKVTSGEEDEKRLLQTNCKLYQFCPNKKVWLERGGGTLRVNESATGKRPISRLVVRSSAVMKVMLNTRIFADMFINRPNATTLRISAQDGDKMSTFLMRCSKSECDKLYTLLIKKREIERENIDEEGERSKVSETEEDLEGGGERSKAEECPDKSTPEEEDKGDTNGEQSKEDEPVTENGTEKHKEKAPGKGEKITDKIEETDDTSKSESN